MTEEQEKRYEELKSKLSINITRLHLDAQQQPHLAFESGEFAAEMKFESKQKRLATDMLKAELDRDVRAQPESFGLSKVTELAVSSAITMNPNVVNSQKISLEADWNADKAAALSNAYEHRRSMLKLEVELFLSNYWGDIEVRERDMGRTKQDSRNQKERRMEEERKHRKE